MASTDIVNTIISTINNVKNPSDEAEKKIEPKVISFDTGNVLKIVENLYLDVASADFHFVFESGDRIPVHTFLLSAGSDVFESNFEGPWKGKSEVKLTVTSVDAFKEFLQFFYMNKAKLTVENIVEVMRLCKDYNLVESITVCAKYLKTVVEDDNVCWAYDLAIKYDEKELMNYCEKIIGYNTSAVLASNSIKMCSRDVLKRLFEMRETLSCQEIEMFEACMKWVKYVSKQEHLTKEIVKEKLGDLFDKINFGAMPFKDISKILISYNYLFSTEEYSKILAMPEESYSQLLSEIRQNHQKLLTKEKLIQYRRGNLMIPNSLPRFLKNIETITFSSDKPLLLTAIKHNNLFIEENQLKDDLPTELTIIEIDPMDSSEKIVLSKEKAIFLKNRYHYEIIGQEDTRVIQLSKIIFIKPKFTYKIHFEQSPPENCTLNVYQYFNDDFKPGHLTFFDETIEFENDSYQYTRGLIGGFNFIPVDNRTRNQLY